MFKIMRLRHKTLIILLMVAVVPLLISLLVLSIFTKKQIAGNMAQLAQSSGNYVERTTEKEQVALTNYMKLISVGSDLVNGTYFASLTGDKGQLDEYLEQILTQYNFDLLEVLDPEGKTLIRKQVEGLSLDEQPQDKNPVITASLKGETSGAVSSYLGHLSILVATPIMLQGKIAGHLIGAYVLDDGFAKHIHELSGVQVAFISPQGVIGASHEDFYKQKLDQLLTESEATVILGNARHIIKTRELGGKNFKFLMAMDLSSETAALHSLRTLMLILIIVVVALVFGVAIAFSRTLTHPILAVVDNLKDIAHGEGDLTRTLKITSRDEVGELANNFNLFLERLREMVHRIRNAAGDIFIATEKIQKASQEVSIGTKRQAESLENSFFAIQGIDESAVEVANEVTSLMSAGDICASAVTELGMTISEIVSQADRLFFTIEEVASSITQMSTASQQVTESIEELSGSMEMTAAAMNEMDASIKEVEEAAQLTNQLSSQASQDAEKGKTVVGKTISGIQAILETVEKAGGAIEEVGTQSSEIGSILTVIDDVSDQTRLLALNASIIAAQAGEHGNGFAVVAGEIRELADRTALSTKEIGEIISRLQMGTAEAIKAMKVGSARVREEVERSKVAEDALEKINVSTLKSAEKVKNIVRTTQEQSRSSQQITKAINTVAGVLQQISVAVKQQSCGIQQQAEAAEAMRDIASQVKSSTEEQAKGSQQISANMERITNMMEQINHSSKEQSERSRKVVEAVSEIRMVAEANDLRTSELDQIVEDLSAQGSVLEKEIGSFKS